MTEYEALNSMQKLLLDLNTMVHVFKGETSDENQAKAERLHDQVINILNVVDAEDLTVIQALGAVLAQVIQNDLEARGELGPCLEPPPSQQSVN